MDGCTTEQKGELFTESCKVLFYELDKEMYGEGKDIMFKIIQLMTERELQLIPKKNDESYEYPDYENGSTENLVWLANNWSKLCARIIREFDIDDYMLDDAHEKLFHSGGILSCLEKRNEDGSMNEYIMNFLNTSLTQFSTSFSYYDTILVCKAELSEVYGQMKTANATYKALEDKRQYTGYNDTDWDDVDFCSHFIDECPPGYLSERIIRTDEKSMDQAVIGFQTKTTTK